MILTILDRWNWDEVREHLLALQAKLNAYFAFVEDGQLLVSYPKAADRDVIIDVITRYPLHMSGVELLARARDACRDLNIEIRTRHVPDDTPPA